MNVNSNADRLFPGWTGATELDITWSDSCPAYSEADEDPFNF